MSNALEAASLIMIPSGYEDGTLGSVKPTDGTGDFTFTRGAGDTCTRINADGYIEKGYENLLLQSNTFSDAAWSNFRINETSGQEGYDGTNDAWLIEKTGSSARIINSISLSGISTFSIYAKANESTSIFMRTANSTDAIFDLVNGVVSNTGFYAISASIEDVGNDWYRCSLTDAQNIVQVSVFISEGSDTSATTGSVYIQDAMVNQGLVAYPYIETTTAPVAGGISEDMPRLDYSNGSCPALLLEPQRTNLVTHSEYFGGWQQSSSPTITANATTSPEGVENAYLLTSTQVSSRVQVPVSPTGTNIQSVYIKYAGSDARVRIAGLAASNDRFEVNVNSSGVVFHSAQSGIIDYSIESVGNDWYRVTSTQSGGSYYQIYIDVTGNNGSIYIYGAQLEQDATYPTSYIPTYGVSQTRLNDYAGATTSLTDAATLFYYFEKTTLTGNRHFFNLSGADSYIQIKDSYAPLSYRFMFYANGGFVVDTTINAGDFEEYKFALVFTRTSLNIFVNGTKYSYSFTDVGFNFTKAQFFKDYNGNSQSPTSNTKCKQIAIFPTALSDDECIALTTI